MKQLCLIRLKNMKILPESSFIQVWRLKYVTVCLINFKTRRFFHDCYIGMGDWKLPQGEYNTVSTRELL